MHNAESLYFAEVIHQVGYSKGFTTFSWKNEKLQVLFVTQERFLHRETSLLLL